MADGALPGIVNSKKIIKTFRFTHERYDTYTNPKYFALAQPWPRSRSPTRRSTSVESEPVSPLKSV